MMSFGWVFDDTDPDGDGAVNKAKLNVDTTLEFRHQPHSTVRNSIILRKNWEIGDLNNVTFVPADGVQLKSPFIKMADCENGHFTTNT